MNDWLLHKVWEVAIEKAVERVIGWLFNLLREWVDEWLHRIIVEPLTEMVKPFAVMVRPLEAIEEIRLDAKQALVVSLTVAAFLAVLFIGIQVTRRAA